MKCLKYKILILHITSIICSFHISGQKRTPNSIGAITDIINPDDIIHHSSIGPILADILCRLCSKIADKKKREYCIKKFCAGIPMFSTSAGISQLARSSGITKFERSSGISKLARSSGLTKLSKSSGISKSPASSGVSTSSTSSGVSKFSKSSARSSNLRSQINKYVYAGINDKIRSGDQSKVMISNLTDILCKLCSNLSAKTKRRDCSVKYCLRSIGALPFIPLRNKHNLRKVRKSTV